MNKKALSEIIAYVMLIVIALAISSVVYVWLKAYVPQDKLECPTAVSLVVKDYHCDVNSNKIELTIQNKGRYDVMGFVISGRKPGADSFDVNFKPVSSHSGADYGDALYFFDVVRYKTDNLHPAEEEDVELYYQEDIDKIEIQPFVSEGNQVAFCDDAVLSLDVEGC